METPQILPNPPSALQCRAKPARSHTEGMSGGKAARKIFRKLSHTEARPAQNDYFSHTEGRSPVLKSSLRSDQGVIVVCIDNRMLRIYGTNSCGNIISFTKVKLGSNSRFIHLTVSGTILSEAAATTLEESNHALNGTPVPLGMSASESRGRASPIFRP